jgi:hypothetical protein
VKQPPGQTSHGSRAQETLSSDPLHLQLMKRMDACKMRDQAEIQVLKVYCPAEELNLSGDRPGNGGSEGSWHTPLPDL